MKWGLQHVKVTLEESDSGEVVVIEQSSDGRITCVPARGSKGRAANSAPRRGPKGADTHEDVKPEPEPEPVVAPRATDKRKAQAKAKSAKPAKPTKKPGNADNKPDRRVTALEWHPVQDHNYHGFAAPSGAGQFKVLITTGSQWALFYELQGTWPKDIRCFLSEDKAKKHAQELHDAGWPESEFGPVTAGQVAAACPAPGPHREQASAPRGKRKTRTEEKENTMPTTEEKPASMPAEPPSKADAAKDTKLMESFNTELNSLLEEEDD